MNQPKPKLDKHFSKYKLKTYKKGAIITHANQEPDGVSLLINGIVEQYDITPEGNKIIVNIFKPSAFFPMSWAINKTENTYFYGALTDVELRQANTNETIAFLKANPDIMYDLLSRVYRGTDALLRRLVLAAIGIASSRLILELLIEAYRFGSEVEENKRQITIRQNVLAARSGLARETITRELHKLERINLISRTKQGIVLDIKKLEDRLDFTI